MTNSGDAEDVLGCFAQTVGMSVPFRELERVLLARRGDTPNRSAVKVGTRYGKWQLRMIALILVS